jgi:hypothetical protein
MVVWLRTERGEIKEYQTVDELRTLCGEYSTIDKWVGAKCGTEWYKEPTPQQECDHLECAIYLAEKK